MPKNLNFTTWYLWLPKYVLRNSVTKNDKSFCKLHPHNSPQTQMKFKAKVRDRGSFALLPQANISLSVTYCTPFCTFDYLTFTSRSIMNCSNHWKLFYQLRGSSRRNLSSHPGLTGGCNRYCILFGSWEQEKCSFFILLSTPGYCKHQMTFSVSCLEAPFQSGSLKRPGSSRQLPSNLRILQNPISSGFNPEGIYV